MKKVFITALIFLCTISCALADASYDLMRSDDDRFKIDLDSAMELALKGNIELQEQKRNLGISKNEVKAANALKNPQIQSNILVGRIGKTNSSQVGIALPIEVRKRGARKQVAQANLLYTHNKIQDYEFKLKLRVKTSYFNLLLAKSNLKIMYDRKELLEDLYEISKNKPKNSDSYQIELLQADMRLKKQLIQINKAQENVRSAQYKFNRVLNLENNLTLYDTKEDSLLDQAFIFDVEIPDYDDLEMTAFQNRFDIRMSEAKIYKAKKEIDVAKRKRVPDLYVSGGYAFAQDGTPGAFVGAGLDLPTLYRYTPEINSAKLNYEKAQLEYNSIINITKNVIHTDHDKLVIARENVQHYMEILNGSKEILKLSKQRYKNGKISLTSLIVVEQSHQDLLNEYINAIGVYYNAYIALLQEIGVDSLTAVKSSQENDL